MELTKVEDALLEALIELYFVPKGYETVMKRFYEASGIKVNYVQMRAKALSMGVPQGLMQRGVRARYVASRLNMDLSSVYNMVSRGDLNSYRWQSDSWIPYEEYQDLRRRRSQAQEDYTAEGLGDKLGFDGQTVSRWRQRGFISGYRFGPRFFYRRSDAEILDAYFKETKAGKIDRKLLKKFLEERGLQLS